MKFQMSPNVAIRINQVSEAVHFFTIVLGFPIRSQMPDLTDIDADPKNAFLIPSIEKRPLPILTTFRR